MNTMFSLLFLFLFFYSGERTKPTVPHSTLTEKTSHPIPPILVPKTSVRRIQTRIGTVNRHPGTYLVRWKDTDKGVDIYCYHCHG